MTHRKSIKTSKVAVAEYWLGTEEGRRRFPGNAALIDFGEPSCFACGFQATRVDEPPEIWQVWSKAVLDRAHLIPRTLGGDDEAPNLVLLCSDCHRDAPNVGDSRYMLEWMGRRESFFSRRIAMFQRAIDTGGLEREYAILAEEVKDDRVSKVLRELLGSWTATHGWYVNESTEEAVMAEAIRRVAGESGRT